MRSQNAKNTPKVEPPKDEVELKQAIFKIIMNNVFDMGSYDVEGTDPETAEAAAQEILGLIKLQQEALLDRLLDNIELKCSIKTLDDSGPRVQLDQVVKVLNKLRLEL